MEKIKIRRENNMQTLLSFKDIVVFLSNEDSVIGDLCIDLLDDSKFDFNQQDEVIYNYLNNLVRTNGNHLDEPVRRLKTIYQTIKRAR
jgi:hypothetical protein